MKIPSIPPEYEVKSSKVLKSNDFGTFSIWDLRHWATRPLTAPKRAVNLAFIGKRGLKRVEGTTICGLLRDTGLI